MARGTITSIDVERGYGVIQLDGVSQKEAVSHSREVIGTTPDALSVGQAVDFGYFKEGRVGRGLATRVRLVPLTGAPGPAERA